MAVLCPTQRVEKVKLGVRIRIEREMTLETGIRIDLTVEMRIHRRRTNMQLIMPSIMALRPLHLRIIPNIGIPHRQLICARNRPAKARRSHGRDAKLDANGPVARCGIVGLVANPGQVVGPVDVRVAGEEDAVVDFVGVEMVEGAVAVSLVALCVVLVACMQ